MTMIHVKLFFTLLSKILNVCLVPLFVMCSSAVLANEVHLDLVCKVVDEASISVLPYKIDISKVMVDKTSPIFRFSGNRLFILEIKPFIDRSDKFQMKTFLRREEKMYDVPIELSHSKIYGNEYKSGEYSFFIETKNGSNLNEGSPILATLKQQKQTDIWIYLLSCSKPMSAHLIEER